MTIPSVHAHHNQSVNSLVINIYRWINPLVSSVSQSVGTFVGKSQLLTDIYSSKNTRQ